MRTVVWYSDGAASAVAAKLAVDLDVPNLEIVKCDTTDDEHPDNVRFRRDIERWIGRKITLIRSEKYAGIDDVFERGRYLAGVAGAKCTTVLKKQVREQYQDYSDVHVFGYTFDEMHRAARFEENYPELTCRWLLIEERIDKRRTLEMIAAAGIELPAMYRLGFDHNNCLGCVKAQSPAYWLRTKALFPDVFERRAAQARELNVRLAKRRGERVFIDELVPEDGDGITSDGDIECGPFCSFQGDLFD